MVKSYALKLPHAVYGGENALAKTAEIVTEQRKVVIFSDRGVIGAGLVKPVIDQVTASGVEYALIDNVPAEPSVEQVENVVKRFRMEHGSFIVAVGGGSVMDTAKLASVLDTDDYTIRDLLDSPGIASKTVKTLMIPTTAGTGSEATPNGIVLVPEKELKVGIVNDNMVADYIIHDAQFIRDLPRSIAASTGIDALAHAIECYTSNKANPYSDIFALEALELILCNIERACNDSDDLQAKGAMLTASFYAGISITASGTTAVHALSYPLGGKYHIAHGVSNAMLLVPVLRFNRDACFDRLARIHDRVYTSDSADSKEAKANWIIDRISEIVQNLDIPVELTKFGVKETDIDLLVEAGMKVTRLLDNNPKPVTAQDVRMLYSQLF